MLRAFKLSPLQSRLASKLKAVFAPKIEKKTTRKSNFYKEQNATSYCTKVNYSFCWFLEQFSGRRKRYPNATQTLLSHSVEPLYNGHPGAELTGRCREVSIRVKSMDRRTIGTKNPGRCGEVATIERWPLVEVQLYSTLYCLVVSALKELRHGWRILKNVVNIFQVGRLQSVSIFPSHSLNSAILVPVWFVITSVVFFYFRKLLFYGFVRFESDILHRKND